jgi:putative membrane protein insertion efficiency factor
VTQMLHTVSTVLPRTPDVTPTVPASPATAPVARRAAVALVRLYQASRGTRPSPCRYVPSCSEYAAESLERHGLFRGSWLAVRRLGRCRPLAGYGSDPVPD